MLLEDSSTKQSLLTITLLYGQHYSPTCGQKPTKHFGLFSYPVLALTASHATYFLLVYTKSGSSYNSKGTLI